MIYLKISICRQQCSTPFSDDCGIAEFMMNGLDEETAARLALALLRNDGWRALNVIETVVATSPNVFVKDGRLRAMYGEAQADGVACAINCNLLPAQAVA
jgi:hypothetical protein